MTLKVSASLLVNIQDFGVVMGQNSRFQYCFWLIFKILVSLSDHSQTFNISIYIKSYSRFQDRSLNELLFKVLVLIVITGLILQVSVSLTDDIEDFSIIIRCHSRFQY